MSGLEIEHVPVERIGALTSWIVVPWALKSLWAPAIEAGRGPRLVVIGLEPRRSCPRCARVQHPRNPRKIAR